MHQSQDRLERQKDKHEDADNGVVVVKQAHRNVIYEPHADTESSNVDEIGEDLEEAMDYPESGRGTEADEDRANWEEQNKGEGSENAVCDQDLLPLG